MVEDRVRIGGAVVFWRLAKSTNREEVMAGLRGLALEKYTPEPRSPLACLRAVLPDVYPAVSRDAKHSTRPIKNGKTKGFAVVRERPNEAHHAGEAWGEVVATAALDDKAILWLDPDDWDKRERIREGMQSAAEWLTSASVAPALVKLVEEHCDGVALRPSGGVYWVREDRLEEWTRIADVFERASAQADKDGNPGSPNAIYVLKVLADEQMVRAVGDALTAEIAAELAQIEQDVANGDLKEQACVSRLKRVGALESKVKRYEAAFASPLTMLHEAVERASVAVAQATLQTSASAIA
jgi:hypothetical protein